jgi:hypothetical protein
VSTTLVLVLEHKQLPGMVKQGNKFLKAFKPLPFDTIKLVSAETGEELLDLPDPEDTATDTPTTATGTATEPSTPSPEEKPDLLAQLNALIPRIKEFAANADVAGQKVGEDLEAKKAILAPKNRLLTLVRDCKGMIGTNDEQAEAILADIEVILNGGQVDPIASTPSPKEKSADADAAGDPRVLFNERLKALLHDIKAAAGTPTGDEAKLKASEAGVFARKMDFAQANALLDQAQAALKSPALSNQVGAWESALADIEPAYLQGLRDYPDHASKLRAEMGFATGKAETGEYSKAIEALQRLDTIISDLAVSPKAQESQPGVNVKAAAAKFDAAKLRTLWEAATDSAMDGISKIEESLRSYSDPQALEAADVLSELVDQFPNSMVDALDALDKAANASDNAGISAARTKVRSSAQACITYLNDNADTIKTCEEENPFGPRLTVAGELKRALKAILQDVG